MRHLRQNRQTKIFPVNTKGTWEILVQKSKSMDIKSKLMDIKINCEFFTNGFTPLPCRSRIILVLTTPVQD